MISILIPAYNVAPYLRACLDSVLDNAGEHHIQVVVCVDARSTDATADIAQEYARRDHRILACIENVKGVGALRNRTLSLAQGSLLMFVDADDILPPGAIDALTNALTPDVDAVFGRVLNNHHKPSPNIKILPGNTAAEQMLYQRHLKKGLHCSLWAKLWRANLWNNVLFPENILYEDLATVPLVTARCKHIALINNPVYYYRRRSGSILRSFSAMRFTSVQAVALLIDNAPTPSFARAARNRQLSAAFNILRLMLRHHKQMPPSLQHLGKTTALPIIRSLRRQTLTNRHSRLRLRVASLLSYPLL